MALVLKDRVKETTTTTGTGTLTLLGAATGFQSFSVIGDGNTTYYTIDGGTEWEVGLGTYTSSGTTLSRDTVLASSAGGTTKVTLSAGTKNVFVTYPADKSIYDDASGNVIALGTPASVTLTNGTGLPISTGVSGLGTGVATFLATPSSANLASAITDETGSGSLVFATLPTFGATGVKFSGSTSGTTTVLSGATAGTSVLTLPVATDTLVGKTTTDTLTNKTLTSPTLTTPVLGTPSSGTLTSCTGLPLTTGVTGTLPIANGGTNATTAPNARTQLGATTVGSNLFTLTNPSAVTFPRFNADNTVSSLDAATFRTAIGAGTGSGTVTSITVSAGTGMSGGGTVTTSGTVTLTNAGVTSVTAGTGISVSAGTGGVTITNSSPNQLTTTTGSPAYYGARAWLSYKGTATRAINQQVNVSSVTYNSAGNYTINFTTSMPDTNYAVIGTAGIGDNQNPWVFNVPSVSTGSCNVTTTRTGLNWTDAANIYVAIFR